VSEQLGDGTFTVEVESLPPGIQGGYTVDRYRVVGQGNYRGVRRRVEVGARYDTFLKYSRFVSAGSLSYAGGAKLSGEVYAGGNIYLNGRPVEFAKNISCTGSVRNKSNGVFGGSVFEGVSPIDLNLAVNINNYRNLAQQAGMYISSTSEIDLGLFDFSGPYVTYDGNPIKDAYGNNIAVDDFNGIVFVEGDAKVKGTLRGKSLSVVASDDVVVMGDIRTGTTGADFSDKLQPPLVFNTGAGKEQVQTVNLNSIMGDGVNELVLRTSGTPWEYLDVYIREDGEEIAHTTLQRQTGSPDDQLSVMKGFMTDPSEHTYTAEIHYKPSKSGGNPVWIEAARGDPVNLGLIAKDYMYIDHHTPRFLTIDAAIVARDNTWKALGYSSDHPPVSGTWDLDGDGKIETYNSDGKNELNVSSSDWVLTINGPIITAKGGSAGPWSSYGVRHYNYSPTIIDYPPPEFPVLLQQWVVTYWRLLKGA